MRNSQTPPKTELRHSKKQDQYIDKKHGAAEPGEAENAAPRQCMRNSQTPPKTELRHSKKQDLRRGQNGTFGTP